MWVNFTSRQEIVGINYEYRVINLRTCKTDRTAAFRCDNHYCCKLILKVGMYAYDIFWWFFDLSRKMITKNVVIHHSKWHQYWIAFFLFLNFDHMERPYGRYDLIFSRNLMTNFSGDQFLNKIANSPFEFLINEFWFVKDQIGITLNWEVMIN